MEGGRPVAYTALETHALYPAESNFWVGGWVGGWGERWW